MSFAKKMIAALEEALSNNVAVKQIIVDGQTVTFADRSQMMAEYTHWKIVASRDSGTRSMFRTLDLS